MTMHTDLWVKAKTPGQPDILALANVSATAASGLVAKLKERDLVVSWQIVDHEPDVGVRSVSPTNAANCEVLLALLDYRTAKAALQLAAEGTA